MSTFYKLAIKDVVRETPEAISVSFFLPTALRALYSFSAGQYLTLKLTLDGEEIRRAYSICSSPNSDELKITIKSIAVGVFSTFANKSLKSGDVVEVGTPEGKFTFEPDHNRSANYAAFAAGSGITPIMSILKSVLEGEPESTFILVYGNKTPEQTIFFDELHQLELQYTGRLFVHYFFSQAKVADHHFGRIDKASVNYVVRNKYQDLLFSKFYLCGPEQMITCVADALKENNVGEDDIKFELFYSAKKAAAKAPDDGHTAIAVTVDDHSSAFSMSRKQNILEAVLKQGIDAPYSCQGGICSSCMARIKKGSAVMVKNTILTEAEIAQGLTLTCQAYPTSSELEVDYDDI